MGKFALRGLAQSMARELSRRAFVAHFVIDGGIPGPNEPADRPDSITDPDAIAFSYWACCNSRAALDGRWNCGRGSKF
jgi:hypothetical protein